ncbi:MAG: TldD/PmbA family protein [Nitrospirales bacterium]|nr:TldD/PmbA family protein [Nitrospirales bacterium]
MIPDETLRKALQTALSHGGDYADIFIESRRTTAVQVEDNRVEKVMEGTLSGAGVRLILGGRTAYAYSNDLSESSILELASVVGKAASVASREAVICLQKRYPEATFSILRPPGVVSTSDKVAQVLKGNEAARQCDTRIRQASVIYRDSLQQVKIATSEGFIVEDERVYTMGMVQVIAAEENTVQTGYESIGGLVGYELFDETPLATLAVKAARRAIMMLSARKAPGGRMPVIISSEAGGTMIHEAIGHGLEADLAQQRLSVYSGKVGSRVASPVVTVIDDGTLPNKRGSFGFDDEGTPSKRNVLVREGILTGYLYDRYTALVDGVPSTGNGRRESYGHKPIPRMTNTLIAPGVSAPDEVIRSVHSGLLVRKMGGGQVNTVTGDFVFDVQEGYMIRNGIVGEPVRGATLTGNGPEVLLSIDMVASDLGFSIGTCGKDGQGVPVSDGMPTLRIPEMVVGGEIR